MCIFIESSLLIFKDIVDYLEAGTLGEFSLEDTINFEDASGWSEYWSTIQDAMGPKLELALAAEISIWQREKSLTSKCP